MSISVHVSVILEPWKWTHGRKKGSNRQKKADVWTEIDTQGNVEKDVVQTKE